jgi:hypothetical protein
MRLHKVGPRPLGKGSEMGRWLRAGKLVPEQKAGLDDVPSGEVLLPLACHLRTGYRRRHRHHLNLLHLPMSVIG